MIPTIRLPPKLIPVFTGESRYRGAYGGRGSGKTRAFATMAAVDGARLAQAGQTGIILCGREFMNSLDESSLAEIKAVIAADPFLTSWYEVGEKFVRTKDGRIEFKFAGPRHNLDSIKSKARIHRLWVDEAEPVSETAWQKIVPTVREHGSEIWVTWNPERKASATHKRFREAPPDGAQIVELNWRDNPMFPEVLEQERLNDMNRRPDSYAHIWEGDFVTTVEGAYFATHINKARADGRIGRVSADPLMTTRAIWDIGGTGAKADACAIWIVQYVGRELRFLDYYEAQGQPLSTHVNWLRESGYGAALCVLPHDGATNDRVHDVSYESALRQAGFHVQVIANQGTGAAMKRVEAARRLFPSMWFNEATTGGGMDAIGWYHEKRDPERNIGLGPNHDWSSHGCFHGHTEVLTRYGTHRIMDLPQTGEVLTPCGWKQYIAPRITIKNAPLVEVQFTDGHSVKSTPDHLFLTVSGWKSAESLTPNTAILSTLTKSPSILTAAYTVCGQAKRIFRAAADAYTGTRGGLLLGQFQTAAISTTGTATFSTTALRTLSVFPRLFTLPKATQSERSRKKDGLAKPPETRPQIGTSHLKAGFGTNATPNAVKAGQSGRGRKSPASIVQSHFSRLSEKAATLASIVLRFASRPITESAASPQPTLLKVKRVERLNETADVWDITVPDGHWFSLANGAVVHNSDAFGLAAVAYELPKQATKLKHVPRKVY